LSIFFSSLIGQTLAIKLLTQAIENDRVAPAYLFTGPEGVGRSLAARCWINQLFHGSGSQSFLEQSNHPDLLWVKPTYLHQGQRLSAIEAAAAGLKRKAPPQIRLEQVREIAQFLSRSALKAARSIVVIEQAETMAEAAANGLLKTLEEPGQATLILIAPSAGSLLPTLVSRCHQIPFYRLSAPEMVEVLTRIEATDVLQHPELIALAQGSPGAAIAAWQQCQTIPAELLQKASQRPQRSLRETLDLARQIDKTLDFEAQIWLIDYLQQTYWQQDGFSIKGLQALEKARQALVCYAQPRLVWEVTLMNLT
jgi:DNA polymerase III subunit delta'